MQTVQLAPPPRRAASWARWSGFVAVLVADVMNLLDSTITQTAAPAIRHNLHGSYAGLEWLSAAYTLAIGALLLLGGRLGDIFGRRRVLLAGIAGFIGASALCACAPSLATLIAARALQGTMAAIMLPQGFGLIRELFGDAGQQKAFAVFGPVMGLAAIAGPLVGGSLVALNVAGAGWRAIFLVNIPLGLIALALGQRYLPRTAAATPNARVDLASALLAIAAGFCLIYPLIQGRQDGWPGWAFGMLAGGLALVGLFALHQARRARAGGTSMVAPQLLRRRSYVAGLAVVVGFIGAMGGMGLGLNVMFQAGLGYTPLRSGIATAVIPVLAVVGSITSSLLVRRLGRTTIHIGTKLMALGLGISALVMASIGGPLSAWDLTAPLALAGFGMGMVFVPMFDVILAGVEPEHAGSASGLLGSVQQLAMSLGVALVGTVLFGSLGSRLGRSPFVHATATAMLVAIGLLALAWLAVWWLPKHARAAG